MDSKLVSAAISNLWSSYMGNSMATCINKYAVQCIEDSKIRELYNYAWQISENNRRQIELLFKSMDFPQPVAFTDADVNPHAPRLFSDHFLLYYLNELSSHGLIAYGRALSLSSDQQIRQSNLQMYNAAVGLYNASLDLMQALNIYDEFPQIPTPDMPVFSKKQSYLGNLLKVQRPLNVIEISSIYANLKKTILAKALGLGFSQTAESNEVRKFMKNAIEAEQKNIEVFTAVLEEDHLNVPKLWDSHVTNSQASPFSDKLMIYHKGFLISLAIADYGAGLSTSTRIDLATHYSAAIARKAKLGVEASTIMVSNEWCEEPPQAADREALSDLRS